MAKRGGHKRRSKGGHKKAMRALRRGKHGVGRRGGRHHPGMEHIFGRASHRRGRRKSKRV